MAVLWRLRCCHHNFWPDFHFLHLYHKFLVWVLLNLCAHNKPVFEEFVLLEEFLITKSFLNLEHTLLFFLILGSLLNNEIGVLPGVGLKLKVKRMTFVLKHSVSQRCVWLISMVIVSDSHALPNILFELYLFFLPLFIQNLLNVEALRFPPSLFEFHVLVYLTLSTLVVFIL